MSFATLFIASAFSTVLSAYLARWIASYLVPEESTSIAAFSFILGGGSLVTINLGVKASEEIFQSASAVGMLLGAAVIWYLFFKRETSNG